MPTEESRGRAYLSYRQSRLADQPLFGQTRLAIARFLELPDWDYYEAHHFPYYKEFPDYGVMVRHGDYYDPLNYSGNRDASSMGDAPGYRSAQSFPGGGKKQAA